MLLLTLSFKLIKKEEKLAKLNNPFFCLKTSVLKTKLGLSFVGLDLAGILHIQIFSDI